MLVRQVVDERLNEQRTKLQCHGKQSVNVPSDSALGHSRIQAGIQSSTIPEALDP
jgi:hypothetical protein